MSTEAHANGELDTVVTLSIEVRAEMKLDRPLRETFNLLKRELAAQLDAKIDGEYLRMASSGDKRLERYGV